jgi:DNA repair protein RecO (recombination protein O)
VPSAAKSRQVQEPGYVLHSYPFRETSLVIEVFTRHRGRLGLVARGARRPRSALRGTLLAFQPLTLVWGGKSELRTLHSAEWQGGVPQLQGLGLMCGFYLNELLLRFLARDDPHEGLFDVYAGAIRDLAAGVDIPATLRRFEKSLLKELGYALLLDREAGGGRPIEADRLYAYVVERGPVPAGELASPEVEVSGQTLIDLACDNYTDPGTLAQSKVLMRYLLGHYLGAKPLHTRQLLRDLQQI